MIKVLRESLEKIGGSALYLYSVAYLIVFYSQISQTVPFR